MDQEDTSSHERTSIYMLDRVDRGACLLGQRRIGHIAREFRCRHVSRDRGSSSCWKDRKSRFLCFAGFFLYYRKGREEKPRKRMIQKGNRSLRLRGASVCRYQQPYTRLRPVLDCVQKAKQRSIIHKLSNTIHNFLSISPQMFGCTYRYTNICCYTPENTYRFSYTI